MRTAAQLVHLLNERKADSVLISLLPILQTLLPLDVEFEHDSWDLLSWYPRRGNRKHFNVYFNKFRNHELRQLVKLHILEKRQRKHIVAATVQTILPPLLLLDRALGERPYTMLSNEVFMDTQALIVAKVEASAAPRCAKFLEDFGGWLTANLSFRISYTCTLTSQYLHGRKATDEQRDAKLIDSRIVSDLIAANRRDDLNTRDRFYLSAFVILAGTGFRINELATLPKDCLVKEGDNVGIRFFPEKKPKLDIRWLPSQWISAVEDTVKKLVVATTAGREAAANLRRDPGLDWSAIVKEKEAAQYFVGQFCHFWTADPVNNMFNQTGAWLERDKRYVDVIKLVDVIGAKGKTAEYLSIGKSTLTALLNAQNAALRNELPKTAKSGGKKIRTSWNTDSRVLSISEFQYHASLITGKESRTHFGHIIQDARDNYQLKGTVFPCPPHDAQIETQFRRVVHPVVESNDGRSLLQPEDALFVIAKNQLTFFNTKFCDYRLVDDKALMRWFAGENRSHGTGNHEDSCFSRLRIIDPKTNKIARFTSHDIRHWLTTYYLEGGMPSAQTALLFNRSPRQNDTYDQTSSKTRLNNMREAIRDGGAIGHVSDTYHEIAEYSREDAEKYLRASTLQLNLMPHGGCSLNWGMKACPNHNGCFNGEDGVCEHLCIDLDDQETRVELIRIGHETEAALSVIPEESPQHEHYRNIQRNLTTLKEDNHHD